MGPYLIDWIERRCHLAINRNAGGDGNSIRFPNVGGAGTMATINQTKSNFLHLLRQELAGFLSMAAIVEPNEGAGGWEAGGRRAGCSPETLRRFARER